jgi:hypothetical protein
MEFVGRVFDPNRLAVDRPPFDRERLVATDGSRPTNPEPDGVKADALLREAVYEVMKK